MNKDERELNIKRARKITTEWPSWKSNYQLTKYSTPSGIPISIKSTNTKLGVKE